MVGRSSPPYRPPCSAKLLQKRPGKLSHPCRSSSICWHWTWPGILENTNQCDLRPISFCFSNLLLSPLSSLLMADLKQMSHAKRWVFCSLLLFVKRRFVSADSLKKTIIFRFILFFSSEGSKRWTLMLSGDSSGDLVKVWWIIITFMFIDMHLWADFFSCKHTPNMQERLRSLISLDHHLQGPLSKWKFWIADQKILPGWDKDRHVLVSKSWGLVTTVKACSVSRFSIGHQNRIHLSVTHF